MNSTYSTRGRVAVNLPDDIIRDYGGGFIGLPHPELYERLLTALPAGILRVDSRVENVAAERGRCVLTHSRTVQGAGPRSATRDATASSGGCGRRTTTRKGSPATCTPPRPPWRTASPTRSRN